MISNAIVCANVESGPVPPTTMDWFVANFPLERRFQFKRDLRLIPARNTIIRDVMLPALASMKDDANPVEWCWFIDNDVTLTHPGLERWLAVQGDIVSCDCHMAEAGAWEGEEAFHTPLWRCRPEVLYMLQPPWFMYPLSEDGCDVLTCECAYFSVKARAAGFTVRHGGYCGHGNVKSWSH